MGDFCAKQIHSFTSHTELTQQELEPSQPAKNDDIKQLLALLLLDNLGLDMCDINECLVLAR